MNVSRCWIHVPWSRGGWAAGCVLVGLSLALAPLMVAQEPEPIDWNRARELHLRDREGGELSPEERAYLNRARSLRREQARAAMPMFDSSGLKPLVDLEPDDRYKEQTGGLYGEGRNEPPPAHRLAAEMAAARIEPLDADGQPSAEGKIVLISVGMSNTTQEFSAFQRLAADDAALHPAVVLVDGAQGGMDAEAWAQPEAALRRGRPNPWDTLARRIDQAGVTPRQVQAVWLKQARINPALLGEFPRHAEALSTDMERIVDELAKRYPNLRIVYLSSRIYAGYARGPLNPEPYAYESAFAVRSVIQRQMAGDRAATPVLLWGPYLWTAGERGRASDGLVFTPDDLAQDGTHPSRQGREKVARQLLAFFKSEATSREWFTKPQ